jgi:signal peptidase I
MPDQNPTKARSPVMAAILGLVAPGAGHLYAVKPVRAIVSLGIALLVYVALSAAGFLTTFVGYVVALSSLVASVAYWTVDPVRVLRKQRQVAVRWYGRWPAIAAYGVFVMFVGSWWWSVGNRHVLGYEIIRVPAKSMEPAVRAQEVVILDRRAFVSKPVTAGQVVSVVDPERGAEKLRRVARAEPGEPTIEVVADNHAQGHDSREWGPLVRDAPTGLATYILWSDRIGRIGRKIE